MPSFRNSRLHSRSGTYREWVKEQRKRREQIARRVSVINQHGLRFVLSAILIVSTYHYSLPWSRHFPLAQILFPIIAGPTPGGGGGGISLVSHTSSHSTDGGNNVQTSGINTTAANSLWLASGSTATATTPQDSCDGGSTWTANSWSSENATNSGGGNGVALWHVRSLTPTVCASHLFRLQSSSTFPSIAVAAFSGSTSATVDGSANQAGTASATSLASGSYTPSGANELVLSAESSDHAIMVNPPTSSSGQTWILTDQDANIGSGAYQVGLAYRVQTTAVAENVTWTITPSASGAIAAVIIGTK